jgi:hypothetical protein
MLSRAIPLLSVIAYDEIVLGTEIEPIETISLQNAESVSSRQHKLLEV